MTTHGTHDTHDEKDERENPLRRAARNAAVLSIGGTALVADKAIETAEKLVDRAGDALDSGRRSTRDAASRASRKVNEKVDELSRVTGGQDARPYEERTRDELYALAAEREIEGRSTMRKAELIDALRAGR